MDFSLYAEKLKKLHDQHTQLFHLATDLKVKALDREYPYIFGLGDVLQRELRTHFLKEETAMLEFGFPHLEHHKQEHAILSSILMRIVLSAEDKDENVAERVDRFAERLVYHVEVHDAAYTNFLTRKLQGGKK